MATVHYPAIIERAGSGFSVFFPDLPGCTSAGTTAQEAALAAEEALSGHLAVSAEHGDDVPAPSALDAIERDPDVDEVGRILVRGEQPGKAVRVQISMEEGLLARIDRVADGNRSGWLAQAARASLAQAPSVTMTPAFAAALATTAEVTMPKPRRTAARKKPRAVVIGVRAEV